MVLNLVYHYIGQRELNGHHLLLVYDALKLSPKINKRTPMFIRESRVVK